MRIGSSLIEERVDQDWRPSIDLVEEEYERRALNHSLRPRRQNCNRWTSRRRRQRHCSRDMNRGVMEPRQRS